MGRLDNNTSTPTNQPDRQDHAVGNKQDPSRQINAHDVTNPGRGGAPDDRTRQPDHSMNDEEPLGEDQVPTDIDTPRQQRHPRREGKGGTP